MRRSVTKLGSPPPAEPKAALVIMTETSVGVGWNDILAGCGSPLDEMQGFFFSSLGEHVRGLFFSLSVG